MDIVRFRNVIKNRTECHDEDTYMIEKCWEEEIDILSSDISSTIEYLKNECTADEYGWISEIIDDVAEKTQSFSLLEEYKKLMDKFPEEYEKYNIAGSIQYAEYALEGGDENG